MFVLSTPLKGSFYFYVQGNTLKSTETLKRQVVRKLGCRVVFLKYLSKEWKFRLVGGRQIADSYFKKMMQNRSVQFSEYPCI